MATTRTTEAQIIRAFVQTVRANNAAFLALVNSMGVTTDGTPHTWDSERIDEGTSPQDTPYPFFTYTMAFAPADDDWTKRILRVGIDLVACSDNQVEASNLDQLAVQVIEDQLATVTGQTTLYCRATEGIRLPEIDQTGKRIFRVGHTYVIWTDQPL